MAIPAVIERKQKSRRRVPSRYPGLTQREARAVDRFRKELRAILPNGELKSLYYYGSKARGEGTVHSDIDLFLVYEDVTEQQKASLDELTLKHMGKPPYIHLLTYRADTLENVNGASRLIYNVSHHGIFLEGSRVPKLEIDRRKVAELNLVRADENLDLGSVALSLDKYRNTISLAYYAAYYAADAALASKGWVAQSHKGTETLIQMHFIRAGLIPESFSGLLGRGHQARIQADYKLEVEFDRADAEYWLKRAQEFVSFVKASLETWLGESAAAES